ncbi:PLC-like phosphodiesterase [Gloeophyllum trabeum ATCC 11539]|uniref:PLC-like phosphodiesterase n=1 Tax=Gloeophyllum trabeum (strain ATCC 11539 / FP-39264 / Madison 617) TaxID=670483 RepID=S7QFF3_GLOTA|nr:PLC-like phosphodiesterase [Gloeophyllum trabeum ATCC 11539]EPQ58546.1 PLC-like phosphodiesterase [Gloeophyllum trabeum ATCC 11539]
MHATVTNLTDDTIFYETSGGRANAERLSIGPSSSTTVAKLGSSFRLHLGRRPSSNSTEDAVYREDKALLRDSSFVIKTRWTTGRSWKVINLPEECPWRIYQIRVSRRQKQVVILPKRDLSSFLSELPDTLPLSSVLLPGTHDTMAFYGWPVSQCQFMETPLPVQLQSGIRVLDIRLSVIKGRLIAYHGLSPQHAPFQHILSTVHAFLSAPATCRETLVMSIKQEDFHVTSPATFSKCVHYEITNGPGGRDMWFLENRVPTLGEVRGRVVMFSRFGRDGAGWEGGTKGLGIHPTNWPDSEKLGFTWPCKNTLVRTHDWYAIPSFLSIPEKVELSTKVLLPPEDDSPIPTLTITYFSAASPLALPPTIARGFGWPSIGLGIEGVNSRVGRWVLDMLSQDSRDQRREDLEKSHQRSSTDGPRIRGWALMDFYTDPVEHGVVPLLVECNYRGRKKGDEGWM